MLALFHDRFKHARRRLGALRFFSRCGPTPAPTFRECQSLCKVPAAAASDVSRKETTMRPELESAAAEVERLTGLRNQAEPGSPEHRELNHKLVKARRRLYEIEWRKRDRR
jgi:hypothetical protein